MTNIIVVFLLVVLSFVSLIYVLYLNQEQNIEEPKSSGISISSKAHRFDSMTTDSILKQYDFEEDEEIKLLMENELKLRHVPPWKFQTSKKT